MIRIEPGMRVPKTGTYDAVSNPPGFESESRPMVAGETAPPTNLLGWSWRLREPSPAPATMTTPFGRVRVSPDGPIALTDPDGRAVKWVMEQLLVAASVGSEPKPERFRVLVPGHTYELPSFESRGLSQMLQFVHKEDPDGSGALHLVADGTTNEAVIEVLIDRLQFLNEKMPSAHNARARYFLALALKELLDRTADRKARGVEGTHKP